jgi:hypothetical protein
VGIEELTANTTYGSTGTRIAAALVTLLVAAGLAGTAGAPAAEAKRFTPAGDKIFAGVSDRGAKRHYFEFAEAAGSRVAVLQSFEAWGGELSEPIKRWNRTETRGMLSISTSPCYECREVISPRQIRRGRGDDYILRVNRELASWDRPTYVRLLPEMNGHWNPYAAFDENGSSRGPSHSTKQFRLAWKRFTLIVRGGPRKRINKRLKRSGMPKLRRSGQRIGKRLPKPQVSMIWVPQTHGSPRIHANRPGAYFPGRRWVDWVGVDIYAKFPNFAGLNRFYKARRGFPFMIGEWAPWDRDDPAFTRKLHRWMERKKRAKMIVYYQGFGDNNPFVLSRYPLSARALSTHLNNGRYVARAPHSRRAPQPQPQPPVEEPAPARGPLG